MKLSVIILNYNVRYFLEQCVSSVQKAIQNIDAEIIVIDNNSSDDSCETMKTLFPNVKLIENKENSGFPKGNNIGVGAAKGEYLCILNPDTVVAEDTFTKSLAFAEKQQNLGIVGVKLIDGRGQFLPESKRGIPTPFVAFTKVAGLYKIAPQLFGKYYANHLTENQTGKVDILVGAFMLLKRETYLEVGGFDENCFMYSDDIDLSYMILKTGKSNYYFHETTVIHYKGESTIRDGMYMQRFQDAMNFFYAKHFRTSKIFDIFMKVGAYLFSLSKKNQLAPTFTPDRHILVSTDLKLQVTIEILLEKKVQLVSQLDENTINTLSGNVEILFDIQHIDFKEAIARMERFTRDSIAFRNVNENFIIGSDSSQSRGEVLTFAVQR